MLDGIAAQLRQLALLQGKGSRLASQLAVQAWAAMMQSHCEWETWCLAFSLVGLVSKLWIQPRAYAAHVWIGWSAWGMLS